MILSNTLRNLFVATAFVAGSLAAVNNALAADTNPAVTVHYTDADIASPESVQALYVRLNSVAKRVCQVDNFRDLSARAKQTACIEDAVARAVATMNVPQLSQLHESGRKLLVADQQSVRTAG